MGKKHQPSSATDVEVGSGRAWVTPYDNQPPPPPPVRQELWISWLMPSFVFVNIVSFAYSLYVNDCPAHRHPLGSPCMFLSLGPFAFEPLSVNPLLGPSPNTLDALGALDYDKVVLDGEGWRLISCIWLHAGVIHLFANMLSLLFIGVRLEQEFGFVKIGLLYVLSGIGGSLMSCLSIRTKISVGASGALFGLLGAMLSELLTNWTIYANKCAALMTLIFIIAINLMVGLIPHVDNSAHIGGFITGFLLGFILLIRPQFGWVSRKHIPPGYNMELVKPKHKTYQYILWFTAFLTLIVGLVLIFGYCLKASLLCLLLYIYSRTAQFRRSL